MNETVGPSRLPSACIRRDADHLRLETLIQQALGDMTHLASLEELNS
ncbi:MAG: hypothetical protein V2I65_04975 [Paracoccaceae bacterium]|jgi:hypothetical protein|nr:hypothetical protein [Paracoccaceae bacterium]